MANIAMAFWGYSCVRIFAKITKIPKYIMTPIIFIFCIVGTYALNHTVEDVFVMLIAGILGYFLLKMDFSIPPIILGMILGKTIESNFRRSLVISGGSMSIFAESPICVVLLLISVCSLFYPIIVSRLKNRKKKAQDDI